MLMIFLPIINDEDIISFKRLFANYILAADISDLLQAYDQNDSECEERGQKTAQQ